MLGGGIRGAICGKCAAGSHDPREFAEFRVGSNKDHHWLTVHNTLGAGFLEKVYENALRIELQKHDVAIRQQAPITIHYDGQVVGEYYADLLVEARSLLS
jgi:hypothetical protein